MDSSVVKECLLAVLRKHHVPFEEQGQAIYFKGDDLPFSIKNFLLDTIKHFLQYEMDHCDLETIIWFLSQLGDVQISSLGEQYSIYFPPKIR